jgi:hypothetical protein
VGLWGGTNDREGRELLRRLAGGVDVAGAGMDRKYDSRSVYCGVKLSRATVERITRRELRPGTVLKP